MVIKLLINALAFYVTAYLVPGFTIENWQALIVAAVVWGILTTFIKPVIVFFTLPLNILTLGLFTFVINAFLLWLISIFVAGFIIENFKTALLTALVLSLVNMFLSKIK